MPPSTPRIEEPSSYLQLTVGYYMTGRFAAINGLIIAPNLMHHAVELLIKFTLLKDIPESQRSAATAQLRQRYGHRLNALWNLYKQHIAPTNLSRLDRVVADLDRWEKIRYASRPDGRPAVQFNGPVPAAVIDAVLSFNQTDNYMFRKDEVDDLISAIFAASGIDPKAVKVHHPMYQELSAWYRWDNEHVIPHLFG